MKNLHLISGVILIIVIGFLLNPLYAGNEQRAGSSGGSELLVNPWARSSAWGNANVANVTGVEGMFMNVAGMAFIRKTELIFSNTQWLVGSGVVINNGGFATKVGETGVLGLSIMNINWGEIEITTDALPEGGIGKYTPTYSVIGLSYSREFSNSIYGGITIKVINESIFNVGASGAALDAGIIYVTGIGKDKAGNRNRDNLRFGITMQNVGTTMKYTGDGMSYMGWSLNGTSMTVEHRSQEFELPSLIRIGFSYKIRLHSVVDQATEEVNSKHNLSIAASFTSNSFTRDQYHIGAEYEFNNVFFLRGGYMYEKDINTVNTQTVLTGPTAGMSVQIPINKENKSVLAIDYSYRFTNPFQGIHTFGVRATL